MTPSPLEHDYIGMSEVSSNGSSGSSATGAGAESDKLSNLKQTELRLGLPGSESPERGSGLSLSINLKGFGSGSGSKRGLDAFSGSAIKWVFNGGSGSDKELFSPKKGGGGADACGAKDAEKKAPAAKAQVVGWPPIRNYRKNTMATANNSLLKKKEEGDGKQGAGCLYVKVSMDGAPYLRKVDLKTYSNYKELALALEKMFSCFTIGQCGSHGTTDLIDGSENVLTYEDKDGDWMLVGDVPWEMFTETCRRLRIMKGSDAIGLAPRATTKCKNRN